MALKVLRDVAVRTFLERGSQPAWSLGQALHPALETQLLQCLGDVAIFADEWAVLKQDRVVGWRGRYAELGTVERIVPLVFAALYVLLFVGRFSG